MIATRCALRAAVVRSGACGALSACRLSPALRPPTARRAISGAAASKVVKVLTAELKHEEGQYEQAKEISAFLKKSGFKLVETPGDVNVALEREVGDKLVRIEWQLTSPFSPDEGEEGGEEVEGDATDFCVSIEKKSGGAGLMFYGSTHTGEEHRYIIGNVKAYTNATEKESVSGYNGPEFEDLDDKMQEAFDEYLAEVGMNNEVCDFIDAFASDKEQREYVRWLKTAKTFLEE